MSLAFPLIAWGAAEDLSAAPWTNIGVPGVTGGQADPFGGTGAYLVDDDNPGGSEGRGRTIGILSGTRATVFPMIRAGTAPQSDFLVVETGTLTTKLNVRSTWAGGVPSVAVVTGGADATLHGVVSLGGGWYGILATIANLTAGLAHEIRCYGSIPGAAPSSVGTTYWYLRNAVLLNYPIGPTSWDEPRDGSEFVEGLDGTADAWLYPRMYHFRGEVIGIPSIGRGSPLVVSGWEGANESIAVNAGVQAMLKAGQDAQTLTFVPDSSLCSISIASKLVKPAKGDRPSSRLNGDRGFGLELRNTSTPYPLPI